MPWWQVRIYQEPFLEALQARLDAQDVDTPPAPPPPSERASERPTGAGFDPFNAAGWGAVGVTQK